MHRLKILVDMLDQCVREKLDTMLPVLIQELRLTIKDLRIPSSPVITQQEPEKEEPFPRKKLPENIRPWEDPSPERLLFNRWAKEFHADRRLAILDLTRELETHFAERSRRWDLIVHRIANDTPSCTNGWRHNINSKGYHRIGVQVKFCSCVEMLFDMRQQKKSGAA